MPQHNKKQKNMEELFDFTKSQLIEAFLKWNKDVAENPDKFNEITLTKKCATEQAEALMKYLGLPTERPEFSLAFGEVIEALKKGKRAVRKGWNGKGMFIFMRPADELNVEFVVDKVKSLPKSVKEYYLQDIINENGERIPVAEEDNVKFTAYLCMKAADGTIVNGWLASQTDMLAEDWTILD